jgi:hypothetical protein
MAGHLECDAVQIEANREKDTLRLDNAPNARLIRGLCILALIGAVQACGGGGGGTAPGPGGGIEPTSPPGGGGNATPTGTVWHNSTPTDAGGSGSKVAQFSGNPNKLIDSNSTAVPTPDGRKYVTYDYNTSPGSSGNVTTLQVKDVVSGSVLRSVVFQGYVRDVRPSPLSSDVVLVKWSSTAGIRETNIEQVVVDLAQRKAIDTLGGADVVANWLGDGRYLLLQANGNLLTATPGGTRTAAGRVVVDGRTVWGLWVSPLGNQMITAWRVTPGASEGSAIPKDLWISDLNGGSLERFTNSGKAGRAGWSPDGKFISYEIEPESVCTGFSCGSPYCFAFYAPASSRNLTDPDPRAVDFKVVSGFAPTAKAVLGCSVTGWTP